MEKTLKQRMDALPPLKMGSKHTCRFFHKYKRIGKHYQASMSRSLWGPDQEAIIEVAIMQCTKCDDVIFKYVREAHSVEVRGLELKDNGVYLPPELKEYKVWPYSQLMWQEGG